MMRETLIQSLDDRSLAVRLRGVEKSFRKKAALRGVDLSVPDGSVYVLVGPNGAGKTTSLRVLLDLVRADRGTTEVLGVPVPEEGPWARAQIGFVPDAHDFGYITLPVEAFLAHHRSYFPTWDDAYADRLSQLLEIPMDSPFGRLSKGQARRVQLVMALAHRPPLLLLDEPTDGLDPLARDLFLSLLTDHLAQTPTTVLISTHLVHEIEGLGDHLGVIKKGRVVAQLPREALQAKLRQFRATVPEEWQAPPEIEAAAIRRRQSQREIQWTLWGDPEELSARLAASGATVQEAEPLTLDLATRALLTLENPS